MKICKKCNKQKSEYRIKNDKEGNTCRDCERDYQKKIFWKNPDKGRKKGREANAKRRKAKGDDVRDKQREYWQKKGKHREKEYYQEMKESDPWEWRARNLRGNINKAITKDWLVGLHTKQSGLCALSGRELDVMSFHIDHIIPKRIKENHELNNLQMVCAEANMCKSGLTEDQLLKLCQDIIKHKYQR